MASTSAIPGERPVPPPISDDDAALFAMGYPRTLARRMTWFDNFALSFTIINVISGIFSGFALGMASGGPRVLVWGWVGVSVMVLFVGAAMAEVASAFPTAGALYYWAAKLAKRRKAAWSWYTGWLNFAGQVGGTAATDYAAATFIQALASLLHPTYHPTPGKTLAIFTAILVVHALANTYTVRLVAWLYRVSAWWLLVGVVVIVGALTLIPDDHRSASFVFTGFVNETGFQSGLYAGAIGLLVTSWTFTGFDGSAHMAEETTQAALSAPKGIMRSIQMSMVVGLLLMLGLVWSIGDYTKELNSPTGQPPAQVLIDALGVRQAEVLLLIVIGAMLFCGLANLTSNSRMIFAFSRDGAMPGSRLWHSVSQRTRTPVMAVWFAAACAMALALPSLVSRVAFGAVVSVNVIGLFGSYGIPIFLRLRRGDDFTPGPWNLGRKSRLVAWIAVTWIVLSSVLFLLPQVNPFMSWNSFNYAPIALAVVLAVACVWWFVTARRSFHGPISYGTPEELAALENL